MVSPKFASKMTVCANRWDSMNQDSRKLWMNKIIKGPNPVNEIEEEEPFYIDGRGVLAISKKWAKKSTKRSANKQ